MSGAAEHPFYMGQGCVVSINVGLPGNAVKGKLWKTHRKTLLHIFVRALTFSVDTIGMLVSEARSATDPYDDDDRNAFDYLFKEAFQIAGAPGHIEIQIFWAQGTPLRRR